MNRYKKHFDDLIKEVQEVIIRKNDGLNHQAIDEEISAFISVYKHGSEQYKEYAKKLLTEFLVNANFVKNKRSIIFDEVK